MDYNNLFEQLRNPDNLVLSERLEINDALVLWLARHVAYRQFVNTSSIYPKSCYEEGMLILESPLSEYTWYRLRACYSDKQSLDTVDRLYMKSLEVEKIARELKAFYSPLLYLNRYLVDISYESSAEFIVDIDEGSIFSITDIHEEDTEMAVACRKDYEQLGFHNFDRGMYTKHVKKISPDIKGDWLTLVRYKDWIMRAICEEKGRYLLIADVSWQIGAHLGMMEVPDGRNLYKMGGKGGC